MPRGIKKVEEIIIEETEEKKAVVIPAEDNRCKCGKYLGTDYKICPKCDLAR